MAYSSSFFQNRDCEYFPCHATDHPEDFNCLFCYCPLYALGKRCGGNFRYTAKGIKDCTPCRIPHERENYHRIISRYPEIMALAKEQDAKTAEGRPGAAELSEGKPKAGEQAEA